MYSREWFKAISRRRYIDISDRSDPAIVQREEKRLKALQEILEGGRRVDYTIIQSTSLSGKTSPSLVQALFPTGDDLVLEYRMYDTGGDMRTKTSLFGDYIPALVSAYTKNLSSIGMHATRQARGKNIPKDIAIENIACTTDPAYPIMGIIHFRKPVYMNPYDESSWAFFALETVPSAMYTELTNTMEFYAMLYSSTTVCLSRPSHVSVSPFGPQTTSPEDES